MEIYQTVTQRIVEHLEAGKGLKAWVRPWVTGGPVNFVSKHEYRRILNKMLLGIVATGKGYSDPFWASFNQIRQAGGMVKAGEKACHVIFAKEIRVPTVNTAEPDSEEAVINQKYRLFKLCPIFNLAQTDLNPEKYRAKFARTEENIGTPNEAAERFIGAINHNVRFGKPEACYVPALDEIHMPDRSNFKTNSDFLVTHIHELAHWSGHPSRLNRLLGRRFGLEAYAAEELTAELTSALLSTEFGIDSESVQHENYLNSWLQTMKKDAKFIFTIAHLATEAAEFLKKEAQSN